MTVEELENLVDLTKRYREEYIGPSDARMLTVARDFLIDVSAEALRSHLVEP